MAVNTTPADCRTLQLTADQVDDVIAALSGITTEQVRRLEESRRRFRALPPHSTSDADERARLRREASDAYRAICAMRSVLTLLTPDRGGFVPSLDHRRPGHLATRQLRAGEPMTG